MHTLVAETKLYCSLEQAFDFFSKAENLNEVTPPDVYFNILTPLPISMQKGTIIDYKIKISGIPFKWRTHIKTWEPLHYFIDEQVKGPYSRWHHTHTFEQKDDHVLMTDKVEYLSPGWILEPLIHRFFVKKRVEAIFVYREKIFKHIFGKPQIS